MALEILYKEINSEDVIVEGVKYTELPEYLQIEEHEDFISILFGDITSYYKIVTIIKNLKTSKAGLLDDVKQIRNYNRNFKKLKTKKIKISL